MPEPRIDILGVYQLPVTEELFREQFGILYGYEMSDRQRAQAEQECRDQLSSVVLIEALVQNRDTGFDIGDFTQPCEDKPKDSWQVAWAEAYLSLDGESLLVERWGDPPQENSFRVAFFIHYWDPAKPLHTSYGAINCPEVQEMADRLKRLVPYEPVD